MQSNKLVEKIVCQRIGTEYRRLSASDLYYSMEHTPTKENLNTNGMRTSFSWNKNNATVVFNEKDYSEEMQIFLNDPMHKSITTHPITYLKKNPSHPRKNSPDT
ncbi:hypothetical protein Trydic_g11038 [Trypoxylus dichotomus]